jgi:hypothetical protein
MFVSDAASRFIRPLSHAQIAAEDRQRMACHRQAMGVVGVPGCYASIPGLRQIGGGAGPGRGSDHGPGAISRAARGV